VQPSLLQSILGDERRVLTVSRVQSGAWGAHNAAFSLPAVVGADGAAHVIEPTLDDRERAALERSANILAEAIASVG
jgi:L-lactate dehydrogenase